MTDILLCVLNITNRITLVVRFLVSSQGLFLYAIKFCIGKAIATHLFQLREQIFVRSYLLTLLR